MCTFLTFVLHAGVRSKLGADDGDTRRSIHLRTRLVPRRDCWSAVPVVFVTLVWRRQDLTDSRVSGRNPN